MDKTVQQELFAVIGSGNLFLLEEAIRGGADVNARAGDPNGDTPLLRAISGGDVEIVRLLLGAGANPNAAGLLAGFTPVMMALDKSEILRELIAAGADVDARTFRKKGADVFRGGGALHFAAASNDAEAVRILIAAGAQIEEVDENGMAPLDLALKRGVPTQAAVALVEAGAPLTPERQRAMHSAAGEPESYLTGNSGISQEVEEILRRAPRAIEFRNRKRPTFKYHVAFWLLIFGFGYSLFTQLGQAGLGGSLSAQDSPFSLILLGFAGLSLFLTWRESDPNCPNCSRNVQSCARNYCHDCGSQLRSGWCPKCEVGDFERGNFWPSYDPSDPRRIHNCPFCGVWLDSGLRRRKWWQRSGLF